MTPIGLISQLSYSQHTIDLKTIVILCLWNKLNKNNRKWSIIDLISKESTQGCFSFLNNFWDYGIITSRFPSLFFFKPSHISFISLSNSYPRFPSLLLHPLSVFFTCINIFKTDHLVLDNQLFWIGLFFWARQFLQLPETLSCL